MKHSWFFCWGVKVRCIVESNEICGTVKLLMNTTLNFSWFNWRKLGEAAGILHWKWNAGKHITASCSPTELRPLDNHPTLTILYMYYVLHRWYWRPQSHTWQPLSSAASAPFTWQPLSSTVIRGWLEMCRECWVLQHQWWIYTIQIDQSVNDWLVYLLSRPNLSHSVCASLGFD